MSTSGMSKRDQKSLRLVGQQSKYLNHLTTQMVKLRDHTGVYGEVRFALEDRREQARSVAEQLAHAEERLTSPTPIGTAGAGQQESAFGYPNAAPAAGPAPDLDSLASSLETLARRLGEMEGVADAQSVSLRKDLARVMEVFEDPGAFLPTPLKHTPLGLGQQQQQQATPANGSDSQRGSRGRDGRQARFSPTSSARSHHGESAYPPPASVLPESTNFAAQYALMSPNPSPPSLLSSSSHRSQHHQGGSPKLRSMASASPELDDIMLDEDGLPVQGFSAPLLDKLHAAGAFDHRRADDQPPSPLSSFRASIARQVNDWRTGKELAESAEEVRRIAREAQGGHQGHAQAQARLHAMTQKEGARKSLAERGSAGRGKKVTGATDSEQQQQQAQSKPSNRRPQPVKPMANSELYPWTAQLQDIFKGVRTANGPALGPNAGAPAPLNAFGGLAQSIPAYLEYQSYLQQQLLAQEQERQEQEAKRLVEEKRAAEEAAKQARARARAAAMPQPPPPPPVAPVVEVLPAPVIPPLPLAAVPLVTTESQTTARLGGQAPMAPFPYAGMYPGGASLPSSAFPPTNLHGAPSQQVFGQHIPKFDAIWEVMPNARDASVQWTGQIQEGSIMHQQQQQQQQYAAPMQDAGTGPMSPRTARGQASLPTSPSHHRHQRSTSSNASAAAGPPSVTTHGGPSQPMIQRVGGGPPQVNSSAGAPRLSPSESSLTLLEQAALDIQRHAQLRGGEGPTSSQALESLLQSANHPYSRLAQAHDTDQTEADVPQHPLFGGTATHQLANMPNSGLLSMVLQMYDMPSDLQISKEWNRVLSQEEAAAAAAAADNAEGKEEKEELKQPEPPAAAEAQQQPQPPALAVPPTPVASTPFIDQTRLSAAEAEAAHLKAELERVKEEARREVQAAKEAAAAREAAAIAAGASNVTVALPPSAPVLLTPAEVAAQREAWEQSTRQRWQIDADAARAAAILAAAEALAKEQRDRDAAQQQKRAEAAEALEAEMAQVREKRLQEAMAAGGPPSAGATTTTVVPSPPTTEDLGAAVSAEVARIRTIQVAEQSMLEHARQEEAARWSAEVKRREEERKRMEERHAEEEARFAARRVEREAEEQRRRELEKRRDELLQQKLALETERTNKEMAALRADVERLRYKAEVATPIPVAFTNRLPMSSYRPGGNPLDSSSSDSSSWTDHSELGGTGRSGLGTTGKHDLSEGEIDLGQPKANRGHSPGQLVPPTAGKLTMLKHRSSKPSSSTRIPAAASSSGSSSRHSGASGVLHSPISSATPMRPGDRRPSTAEEKYPHPTTEVQNSYDSQANNTSSSRDDIADLLSRSTRLKESSLTDSQSTIGSLPLRTEQNIGYNTAVSQMHRALAAPSRQVLVGSPSPPLSASLAVDDLSRLVRGSIDDSSSIDLGASTENVIGGLYGMDRPSTARSMLAKANEDDDLLDDSILQDSLNSPKAGATEQWLRSLKDQ